MELIEFLCKLLLSQTVCRLNPFAFTSRLLDTYLAAILQYGGRAHFLNLLFFKYNLTFRDRFCGLVVRVSGYRYRGPGFDHRRYQIFWVVVGLERGPLSLVRSIEELLERKK